MPKRIKQTADLLDLRQEIALFEERMKFIYIACCAIKLSMRRKSDAGVAENIQSMVEAIEGLSIEHRIAALKMS